MVDFFEELSVESFLQELQALGVPMWSKASFREATEGCSSQFLGRG